MSGMTPLVTSAINGIPTIESVAALEGRGTETQSGLTRVCKRSLRFSNLMATIATVAGPTATVAGRGLREAERPSGMDTVSTSDTSAIKGTTSPAQSSAIER